MLWASSSSIVLLNSLKMGFLVCSRLGNGGIIMPCSAGTEVGGGEDRNETAEDRGVDSETWFGTSKPSSCFSDR